MSLPDSNDLFLEAVNTALAIEEPADVANVLLQITAALFKVENTDYAHALLQKTFKRIRELEDIKERTYLLRLFVTLQCKHNLVDEAAEVLPLIDDSEQKAVALKELAFAQVQAGRLTDALKTAEEEIEDFDDYEEVLIAVGEKQIERKLFTEARATASLIETDDLRNRLMQNIDGESVTEISANISIEAAREIDDLLHRSSAVCEIGITLHKKGKTLEAIAVFRETLNAIQQIRNTYSKTNALTEFAGRLARLEITDSAVRVFRLAVAAAQEIDDVSFSLSCLCKIIDSQVTANLFDEAFATLRIIEELREDVPRKSAERSPFDRDYAVALGTLATALTDSSDEEESIPLLQKSLDVIRSIADPQCRAIALLRLAVILGQAF